jgi:hypothetical protein
VSPRSVRSSRGEVVPILTDEFEERIVADMALAAADYIDWTAEHCFATGPGRESARADRTLVGIADGARAR